MELKKELRAIIADDETGAREVLESLITDFFPHIKIIGKCGHLMECVDLIKSSSPDVVFMDIEMPEFSGLEIYKFLKEDEMTFELIFTTAYREYAIQAFRLSAIDYLLKPIQFHQLEEAIDRIFKSKESKTAKRQLEILQKNMEDGKEKELCISTTEGKYYVPFSNIMYMEADGSYSIIYTTENKKIHASRRLKYFEVLVAEDERFIRIHRSFVVNKTYVERIKRGEDAHITLKNGQQLSASVERLNELGIR